MSDDNGVVYGNSVNAAQEGIAQVTLSRIFMACPGELASAHTQRDSRIPLDKRPESFTQSAVNCCSFIIVHYPHFFLNPRSLAPHHVFHVILLLTLRVDAAHQGGNTGESGEKGKQKMMEGEERGRMTERNEFI